MTARLEYKLKFIYPEDSKIIPINSRYLLKETTLINVENNKEDKLDCDNVVVMPGGKMLFTYLNNLLDEQYSYYDWERKECKYILATKFKDDNSIVTVYDVSGDKTHVNSFTVKTSLPPLPVNETTVVYLLGGTIIVNILTGETSKSDLVLFPFFNSKLINVDPGCTIEINEYDLDFNIKRKIDIDTPDKLGAAVTAQFARTLEDDKNYYLAMAYDNEINDGFKTFMYHIDNEATLIKDDIHVFEDRDHTVRYLPNHLLVPNGEQGKLLFDMFSKTFTKLDIAEIAPLYYFPPYTTCYTNRPIHIIAAIHDPKVRLIRVKPFLDIQFPTKVERLTLKCTIHVFMKEHIAKDICDMIFSCIDI